MWDRDFDDFWHIGRQKKKTNKFFEYEEDGWYLIRDRLTNPNLEFTLFTDRSLSFNTATRLLLLDLQALAALERA